MLRMWCFALLTLFTPVAAHADQPLIDDSQAAACALIKKAAMDHLHTTEKDPNQLYCEFTSEENAYLFIAALRHRNPTSKNYFHSNLIGWYAAMRRSDVVLEYDMAELRLTYLH